MVTLVKAHIVGPTGAVSILRNQFLTIAAITAPNLVLLRYLSHINKNGHTPTMNMARFSRLIFFYSASPIVLT